MGIRLREVMAKMLLTQKNGELIESAVFCFGSH